MNTAILALILLRAGLTDASAQPIGYEVKVLQMEGIEWRASLRSGLTQIAREGQSTLWVAPKDATGEVTRKAVDVVYAPKTAGEMRISGSIQQATRRPYIASVTREADGPVDQATSLLLKPVPEYLEESLSVGVRCQKMSTGVIVALKIDESHLISLATYTVGEQVNTRDATGVLKPVILQANIQVPEMAVGRVDGEWLIPHEHSLIVSLGIHTVLRNGNTPTVTERVAIITPNPNLVLPAAPTPTEDVAMTLAAAPLAKRVRPDTPAPATTAPAPPLPLSESGLWKGMESHAPAAPQAAPSPNTPIIVNSPTQGTVVIIVPGQGLPQVTNLSINTTTKAKPGAEPAPGPSPIPPLPSPAAAQPDAAPPPPSTAAASPSVRISPPVTPDPPPSPFGSNVPTDPTIPTPPIPTRMLPTPLNAQGEVIPLPDLFEHSEALKGSAEPAGSGPVYPSPSSNHIFSAPAPAQPGGFDGPVTIAPTKAGTGRKFGWVSAVKEAHRRLTTNIEIGPNDEVACEAADGIEVISPEQPDEAPGDCSENSCCEDDKETAATTSNSTSDPAVIQTAGETDEEDEDHRLGFGLIIGRRSLLFEPSLTPGGWRLRLPLVSGLLSYQMTLDFVADPAKYRTFFKFEKEFFPHSDEE